MMYLLGIDDATASGWGLLDAPHGADPSIVASGTLKLTMKESHARQVYRLLRGLPARPEHVAVEMPVPYYEDDGNKRHIRNWQGVLTQAWIMGLWADAVFEVFGFRVEYVAPSKWQSALLKGAFGESTKSRSFNFCLRKWGYRPADDNEADALCIAFWLHTRYGFVPRFDPTDKNAGTKRALAENIRRHGGDPMMLQLLEEKERRK
jgi:hypothetical protein